MQCSDSYDQNMIFLIETAVFLWEKLNEYKTKEELVEELIATYDVPESIAEEDIAGFMAFLAQNDCLTQEGEVEGATI